MIVTVIGDVKAKEVLTYVFAQQKYKQLICNRQNVLRHKKTTEIRSEFMFYDKDVVFCNTDVNYPSELLDMTHSWYYGDKTTILDYQIWSIFFSVINKPVNRGYFSYVQSKEVGNLQLVVADLMKMTDAVIYCKYCSESEELSVLQSKSQKVLFQIYDTFIEYLLKDYKCKVIPFEVNFDLYQNIDICKGLDHKEIYRNIMGVL